MAVTGNNTNPNNMSDEELVALAQAGDKPALEAVLVRYKNLVYAKAKSYFLAGAEADDLIQEGFIGLYRAVEDFNPEKHSYFKAFAGICVSRRILTAVKTSTRRKHQPLNSYVSLDSNDYKSERGTVISEMPASKELQDPEAIVIDRENADGIEYKINKALSKFELEVLLYYMRDMSYKEIAAILGKDTKAVDNAVQRIRKKLEIILDTKS